MFLINLQDVDGNAPLHHAALNRQCQVPHQQPAAKVVKLLLDSGSDPRAKTSVGLSTLSCAAISGDLDTVTTIMNSAGRVEVDTPDNNNTTALHYAAK